MTCSKGPFSPHPYQHLSFLFDFYEHILIYIFLIAKDTEHFLKYVLPVFFYKTLLSSLTYLLKAALYICFVLLKLFILNISSFKIQLADYFLQLYGLIAHPADCGFWYAKAF